MSGLQLPVFDDLLSLRIVNIVRAPTLEAAAIYLAWIAWLFLLSHLVPGYYAQGQPLADGRRLTYKINGTLRWPLCFVHPRRRRPPPFGDRPRPPPSRRSDICAAMTDGICDVM